MEQLPIHFPELPYYLTVSAIVNRERQNAQVRVDSKIHVEKIAFLPMSFKLDYVKDCNARFRKDVLQYIVQRYGLRLAPTRYE